jgi:adenylylsulfate kinase
VVCAILSIFPETREWNRENIKNYYEVFIDVPLDILIKRDSKGIYRKYQNGEVVDVVGMDIKFSMPEKSDLVIKNIKSKKELLNYSKLIVEKFHL